MSHTPWTQEQAEKWAREEWERFKEANPPKGQAQFYYKDNREYFLDGFKIALAKAAEMIESAPTVYGETTIVQYGREVPTGNWTETRIDTYDTHSAKLVGVREIDGGEK